MDQALVAIRQDMEEKQAAAVAAVEADTASRLAVLEARCAAATAEIAETEAELSAMRSCLHQFQTGQKGACSITLAICCSADSFTVS